MKYEEQYDPALVDTVISCIYWVLRKLRTYKGPHKQLSKMIWHLKSAPSLGNLNRARECVKNFFKGLSDIFMTTIMWLLLTLRAEDEPSTIRSSTLSQA